MDNDVQIQKQIDECITILKEYQNNQTVKKNEQIGKKISGILFNIYTNPGDISLSRLMDIISTLKTEIDNASKTIYVYNKEGKKGENRAKQDKKIFHCEKCQSVLQDFGKYFKCPSCNILIDRIYSEFKQQGQAEDPYAKCMKYCSLISGTYKISSEIYYFCNHLVLELNKLAKNLIKKFDLDEKNKMERLKYFYENGIKENTKEISSYYLKKYRNRFKMSNYPLSLEDLAAIDISIEYKKNEKINFDNPISIIPILIIPNIKDFREICKSIQKTLKAEDKANFTPQHYIYLQTVYRLIYKPKNMVIIDQEDAKKISEIYVEFDKKYLENSVNVQTDKRVNRRKITQIIKIIISSCPDLKKKYPNLMIIESTSQTANNNEKYFVDCLKKSSISN